MILTGSEINHRVGTGEIEITPYRVEQINPSSYDLTLGNQAAVQKPLSGAFGGYLDAKEVPDVESSTIPESGIFIKPGYVYLLHTEEIVCAPNFVGVVDGKSSIGRLGLVVHVTAGYIDPGFRGQITLEVATLGVAVRIYAGMRFAQIRFSVPLGDVTDYQLSGNYVGDASMGPVPSKCWKQFVKG